MIIGRFVAARAARRAAPPIPQRAAIRGAQLVALPCPPFLFAGIERARILPRLIAASPREFVHNS